MKRLAEEHLSKWISGGRRKPLILRGARPQSPHRDRVLLGHVHDARRICGRIDVEVKLLGEEDDIRAGLVIFLLESTRVLRE